MQNYYKYLPVSAEDEKWGLCVLNVGSSRINKSEPYPPEDHPAHHFFDWNKGRILNEYQIIYITKGEGLFESQSCMHKVVKEGTILLLFPGEWHRFKPNIQTGWDEFSRDAEPVKGSFNDNYYYQLVDHIRKFKGSRPVPVYSTTNKISVDGRFEDWQKTEAVFLDDRGDVLHRKHPGWGRIKEYTNNTGRNDIVESKVTSDKDNIYFYVKTANALTPWNSPDWMRLFITVNGAGVGWEGFTFMVNRNIQSSGNTILEYSKGGWNWEKLADIKYRFGDHQLELAIPKKVLGINGDKFFLDFKWSDNAPADGNAMNWLDKGDAAPNARFSYRYIKN